MAEGKVYMLQWILDILRGAVIGVSNIIPGVSGGTMAVSMGVNEYRMKKAMSAAGRRTAAELKKSLDSAFQVEKDIKNGVMPPRMALELFIAGL